MSLRAIPPLIGLTTQGLMNNEISPSELTDCAAALQSQIIHDFAPVWHQTATVTAYPDSTKVPAGTWQLIVQPSLDDPGALGYHTDNNNQPVSYIEYTDKWTITVDHECLEMLADPWGNRLVTTHDPRGVAYGRAHVLVEVADPCEGYAYPVLGVPMSDFVLPAYYGSRSRTRVTHLGNNLTKPLMLAPGGYLSWLASNREWYQLVWFDGSGPQVRDLGASDAAMVDSLRAWVDSVTARDALPHIGASIDY